jgi:amidase
MLKQCALSGEPLIKEVQRFVSADDPAVPIPLLSFEGLTVQKEDFENKYHDYWNSTSDKTGTAHPVDGVILPVAPTAAVINDKYMYYGYTNVANLLDYTCVSFPVTTADRDLDVADRDYMPLNDLDRDNWNAYDPQAYHGAPVGLQVMGRRLEEEKMLSVSEAIVTALDASRQT